jgi:hypothetical protein
MERRHARYGGSCRHRIGPEQREHRAFGHGQVDAIELDLQICDLAVAADL